MDASQSLSNDLPARAWTQEGEKRALTRAQDTNARSRARKIKPAAAPDRTRGTGTARRRSRRNALPMRSSLRRSSRKRCWRRTGDSAPPIRARKTITCGLRSARNSGGAGTRNASGPCPRMKPSGPPSSNAKRTAAAMAPEIAAEAPTSGASSPGCVSRCTSAPAAAVTAKNARNRTGRNATPPAFRTPATRRD